MSTPRLARTLPAVAGAARRARGDDRGGGYLAAFIVLFGTLTLAGVGVLVDSARLVASHRQCDSVALEAARAGANALDVAVLRDGTVTVDAAAAQAAASRAAAASVAGSGVQLSSVTVDGPRVSVRVAATVDPWFPVMATRTVTSAASATATEGSG